MSNSNSPNFQAQEYQFVSTIINSSSHRQPSAKQIQQMIKQQLGIERSLSQISAITAKVYSMSLISDKHPGVRNDSEIEPMQSLFHSFSQQANYQQNAHLLPVKKQTANKTIFPFQSRRKIAPTQDHSSVNQALSDHFKLVQQVNDQCTFAIAKLDRKSSKKIWLPSVDTVNEKLTWFYNQYFYSNYDGRYFKRQVMTQIRNSLGLPIVDCYSRHRKLLGSLPKPAVFDDDLITFEKRELNRYRSSYRLRNKQLSRHNKATDYPVQSTVLALHPLCGHLHSGSILAYYKESYYMVKFMRSHLPTQKISDTQMTTELSGLTSQMFRQDHSPPISCENDHNENIESQIVGSVNAQTVAYLIKLLSYKNSFICYLRALNDQLSLLKDESLQTSFLELNRPNYLWAFRVLQRLQIVIKQTLIRFRLRGVNQSNNEVVFNNLDQLVANPLKLMSRQFENSTEPSDQQASSRIKSILTKKREDEIDQALQRVVTQAGSNSKNCNENIMKLVKACLSVLVDLKYEGKEFDLYNNQNLCKLNQCTNEHQLTQDFNQAYQQIQKILFKIKR